MFPLINSGNMQTGVACLLSLSLPAVCGGRFLVSELFPGSAVQRGAKKPEREPWLGSMKSKAAVVNVRNVPTCRLIL